MDSIDPAQSTTRFLHPSQSQVGKKKIGDARQAIERPLHLQQPSNKSAYYSGVFDDEALERLQSNLQSVSDLATQALKRLKKEA